MIPIYRIIGLKYAMSSLAFDLIIKYKYTIGAIYNTDNYCYFVSLYSFLSRDNFATSPRIILINSWLNSTSYNSSLSFLMWLLIVILKILYIYHGYDLKSHLRLLLSLFLLVNDLITLYIVVELQAYPSYLLTALHTSSYFSSRASLIYFL